MDDDVTHIVVNATSQDLEADDTHCCSSEESNSLEWPIISGPDIQLWKIIPPVIIVLGTFGNVMTIVMMRRMSEGQSSHTMSLYFTALAVSDLVILYSGLIRRWLDYLLDVSIVKKYVVLCKLLPFLVYSSGTISAWLIVAMTMQRVMSVVWPHYKSLSCTKMKVKLVIATIVVIPISLNSFIAFSYEIEITPTEVLCGSANKQIDLFDTLIYPWIDLTVSSFLPFCILIIGNIVLVRKVIQSVHVARVMTAGGCDQVNSRQKKASSLTLTLITVSMVFLLLSMPICTYILIAPYINTHEDGLVFAFCDLSWYVNSAINFYLYCLTGSKFRNELRSLICKRPPALKTSTVTSLTNVTTRFT